MSSERSIRPESRETSHSLNTIGGLVGREDGCLHREAFVPEAGRPRTALAFSAVQFLRQEDCSAEGGCRSGIIYLTRFQASDDVFSYSS